MKIAIMNRKKVVGAVFLMGIAILVAMRSARLYQFPAVAASTGSVRSMNGPAVQPRIGASDSFDPTLQYSKLIAVENEPYEGSGRNIFRSEADVPFKSDSVIPTPPDSSIHDHIDPAAPQIHLRFFGFALTVDQKKKVFLSEEDAVFIATEGDIVNRRYKLVRVDLDSVTVEDMVEHGRHTLSLSG